MSDEALSRLAGRVIPGQDPVRSQPGGESEHGQGAALASAGRARLLLLAALDALAREHTVSAEALATAIEHEPVLGHADPGKVFAALQRTADPVKVSDRRETAEALQQGGHQATEASLWLEELKDELIDRPPHQGLWVSEECESEVEFLASPDGVLIPGVMRHERSRSEPVAQRVSRLVADFQAIPAEEEPWNLILDHGASRERPNLLVEHERREGISRRQADDDWRRAKRSLIKSGRCGTLTPLLVALRDGGPAEVDRQLRRLRAYCRRNGLSPLARKARLQGK